MSNLKLSKIFQNWTVFLNKILDSFKIRHSFFRHESFNLDRICAVYIGQICPNSSVKLVLHQRRKVGRKLRRKVALKVWLYFVLLYRLWRKERLLKVGLFCAAFRCTFRRWCNTSFIVFKIALFKRLTVIYCKVDSSEQFTLY